MDSQNYKSQPYIRIGLIISRNEKRNNIFCSFPVYFIIKYYQSSGSIIDEHGGVKTRWDFATRFTTFFLRRFVYIQVTQHVGKILPSFALLYLSECYVYFMVVYFLLKEKLSEWVISFDEVDMEIKFLNKHKFNLRRGILWIMEIQPEISFRLSPVIGRSK